MARFVVICGDDIYDANWAIPCNTQEDARSVVLHELLHFLYQNYANFLAKYANSLRTLDGVRIANKIEEYPLLIDIENDTFQWMTEKGEKLCTMLIAEEGDQGIYIAFDGGSRSTWADAYSGQDVQSDAGEPIIVDTTSIETGKRWDR